MKNKFSYSAQEKTLIKDTIIDSTVIGDDTDIDYTIDRIENIINIYLGLNSYYENLPTSKKRKEIIAKSKTDTLYAPDWLRDLLLPARSGDQKNKIIDRLLNFSDGMRPGPEKHLDRVYLIKELGIMYFQCTGKKPSVTWRPDKERSEGKFFKFVEACLQPLGFRHLKHNPTLAIDIKRILNRKEWEKLIASVSG